MRLILLPLIFGLLAACSSSSGIGQALDSRQNAGPCPVAGSVYDSARIVSFADGTAQRLKNVTNTGEITDVRIQCRYAADDPIRLSLDIDFAFGKGASATDTKAEYKYFVAVTRPNGRVLNRSIQSISTNFGNGDVNATTQSIDPIIIPRADDSVSGTNFEILVGFVLTDEELAFNREGRRFLLNTGS